MRLQDLSAAKKQNCIRGLVVATCLVTFQAYLIAPITPALARELHATSFEIGFSIPSFAIPFGISSFLSCLIVDYVNRKTTLIRLLTIIAIALIVLSAANNAIFFLFVRAIIGLLSGTVVQLSMSMMNDMFLADERDKPFSWLILAQATGMTFGPSAGVFLYPLIGWRWEFMLLTFWVLLALIFTSQNSLQFPARVYKPINWKVTFKKCRLLLSHNEGKKIYSFIYLNGIFHSGLFVWISYYFNVVYKFGNHGMGLGLLLFGLPGLLMAVVIGLAAQKYGMTHMMTWGLITIGVVIIILVLQTTFWLALFAIGILSLAYVMTQPFYAGIINSIRNRKSRGLAIGLGFGLLFLGYGTGPIIFQLLLKKDMLPALGALFILAIVLAALCRRRNVRQQHSLVNLNTEKS